MMKLISVGTSQLGDMMLVLMFAFFKKKFFSYFFTYCFRNYFFIPKLGILCVVPQINLRKSKILNGDDSANIVL